MLRVGKKNLQTCLILMTTQDQQHQRLSVNVFETKVTHVTVDNVELTVLFHFPTEKISTCCSMA